MKLSLTKAVGKRPYPTSFWVILLAIPGFIIFGGVNLLLWQSQIGQAAWLLAKVSIRLVPPLFWLGGATIVALWLLLLRWLWLPQSS